MERGENKQVGTLKVSENVIATIARLATTEITGVEQLVNTDNSIKQVLFKRTENDAIKIRLTGDVVEISVSIAVKFGNNVVSVAEQIQDSIKQSVQSMTGVTVARVNVYIAGIVFDDTAKN